MELPSGRQFSTQLGPIIGADIVSECIGVQYRNIRMVYCFVQHERLTSNFTMEAP